MILSLELTIQHEKVSESLRKEVKPRFNFLSESLLVVPVELQTSNDSLLTNIKERDDQRAL